MKKYNKTILKEHTEYLFGEDYTLYILDDNEYYNIHIVNEHYQDNEMNTLHLQEPKEDISLDDMDALYITKLLLEYALWDKFYGYKDKSYSFSIETVDTINLKEEYTA